MATAITHHRFGSPVWGDVEVRKLLAELAEIDATVGVGFAPLPAATPERADRTHLLSHPNGGWIG
jgi:hypothetical protein